MKWYVLRTAPRRYQLLVPIGRASAQALARFDATRRLPDWRPAELEYFAEDAEHRERPHSDLVPGLVVPVFSARARDVLRELLAPCGEFLPLRCAGRDLSAFNATVVIDALDRATSEIRALSSGKVFHMGRCCLKRDALSAAPAAFKLRDYETGPIVVSAQVKAVCDEHGLVGFDFGEAQTS